MGEHKPSRTKRSRKDKSSKNDRNIYSLGETEVATVAAAVAAAANASNEGDENHRVSSTENIDWEALATDASSIPGPGDEEEEEMGAQALLQLGTATKKKKKKRKGETKTKTKTIRKQEDNAIEATSTAANGDDGQVDITTKSIEQLGSLDHEFVTNDTSSEYLATTLKPQEKKKRKRSGTINNLAAPGTDVSSMTAAANEGSSNFESELQEFFHSGNPGWGRFYTESIGDDPASQVDINMLLEEQASYNQQASKSPKKQKRTSNVDPALEQLDEPSSLEMTTKEQSQLEDAMMHASAIVRTLTSGGSQPQLSNESTLLNPAEKGRKKRQKNEREPVYDEDLLNEAIKFAHNGGELDFENRADQNNTDSSLQTFPQAESSNHRPKSSQGDLAAISLAKDPSLLNPGRTSSVHQLSKPRKSTLDGSINSNWNYTALPHEGQEKARQTNWRTTGNEHGGSFSQAEMDQINNFMLSYCTTHNLTRDKFCQRVWASERRKDTFWDEASSTLPHRTRSSVYKHIRRAYHVFSARGKWSPTEDKELGYLVEEKGKQWKQIGLMLGRMPEDCRDRWRNYVKCGDSRIQNKWGVDEEERLRTVMTQLMASFPGEDVNWTEVSDLMGGTRSRIQCRYKWIKLSRRISLAKVDAMLPGDRISLLQLMKDSGYEEESSVDWDGLAALDPRGFWSGEELHVAYERMQETVAGSSKKPMRQIVSELLTELQTLPEHRQLEKFHVENESTGTGTVSDNSGGALPQSDVGKKLQQQKSQSKIMKNGGGKGGDLELTDDIIAVAAAAHAAMQESQASNDSGLDGGLPKSKKSKRKKATVDAGGTGGGDKSRKNNDFYGTPPTASAFQQHQQQHQKKSQPAALSWVTDNWES